MADEQLYPVFNIPTLVTAEDDTEKAFKPGPLFDYDKGDFVRDGANRVVMVEGRDAYILWCLKTLKTQLGACDGYPGFGIDTEDCLNQPTREAVQVAFERTISEALLANPCTAKVFHFEFEWEADTLNIQFLVKPQAWDAFDINMNVVT